MSKKGVFANLKFEANVPKLQPGVQGRRDSLVVGLRKQIDIFEDEEKRHVKQRGRGKWFTIVGSEVYLKMYHRNSLLKFGGEEGDAVIDIPMHLFSRTMEEIIEGVEAGDADEELELADAEAEARADERASKKLADTKVKHGEKIEKDDYYGEDGEGPDYGVADGDHLPIKTSQ